MKFVFETVVRRCMDEGLVKGEGFAIDASWVKADVNRQRAVSRGTSIDWGRLNFTLALCVNTLKGIDTLARPK